MVEDCRLLREVVFLIGISLMRGDEQTLCDRCRKDEESRPERSSNATWKNHDEGESSDRRSP